jgi:NAD(P)-dependent dehydrogenase (short-subunit alcohol dehydrogenase family)
MNWDLSDQVAIVTGGSRGIGRAIAVALADAGAKVVVASRKQAPLEAVAAEIEGRGGTALAVPTHVGHEEEVAALARRTLDAFGKVTILVNNAGTNPHLGPTLEATAAQWDKIMEVNLRGAFLLCQNVVPSMIESGGGRIINVASVEGLQPSRGLGVYSVSKAGLIMLTKALAQELGPQGIRVNALAPGLIRTDLSRALWESESVAGAVVAHTPLHRIGDPNDVVGAVLFLASPLSGYVNGAVITVDGGLSIVGGFG